MSRPKPYVGKTFSGEYRVFRSAVTPTEETHGESFVIAYGPFETVSGARLWRDIVSERGLVITQDQAERLIRKERLARRQVRS